MHGTSRKIGLLAFALLVAGCGGAGPALVPRTQTPPAAQPPPPQQGAERPAGEEQAFPVMPFDKFTRDKQGDLADPINLAFVATHGQILEAARRGGWLGADPITPWTTLKLVNAALRHKPYPTAPFSDLFMFGRDQDVALQIPTNHVAVRDHFRLWETGLKDRTGRPVWVGAGTKDVAIKLEPGTNKTSHQIDPKIDEEREVIVSSFLQTGLVAKNYRIPGIGAHHDGVNGSGDRYFTDGMVAVLELKLFAAPEPKKKKKT